MVEVDIELMNYTDNEDPHARASSEYSYASPEFLCFDTDFLELKNIDNTGWGKIPSLIDDALEWQALSERYLFDEEMDLANAPANEETGDWDFSRVRNRYDRWEESFFGLTDNEMPSDKQKDDFARFWKKFYRAKKQRDNRFHFFAGLDTHRWINRLYRSWNENFDASDSDSFYTEVCVPIITTHGFLFGNVQRDLPSAHDLSDWAEEIKQLCLSFGPLSKEQNSITQLGQNIEFTAFHGNAHLLLTEEIQVNALKNSGFRLGFNSITLSPNRGLLDWCWILVVRDRLFNLTYSICPGCQRSD